MGPWLGMLFIAVLLKAMTPVFFKSAALELDEFSFVSVATNLFYWISLAIFALRAITWQLVLRHLPLSLVYPVSSLSLVILMMTAYLVFDEPVTDYQLVAAPLIVLGSILVAGSGKSDSV